MRSRWDSVHADLAHSVRSNRSVLAFTVLKAGDPVRLGAFQDAEALLAKLSDRGAAPIEEQNQILAGLVGGAGVPSTRTLAVELLLLGLWPGLSTMFSRLGRFYGGRSDELAADILARFTECVRRLDLRRCARIAPTLIRNTERVTRGARLVELRRASCTEPTDDSSPVADPGGRMQTDLVELRLWLGRAIPHDAELVFAIVAGGVSCRQAAAALGISYATVRQRLARAMAAIREKIARATVTV
jgi:hypothetical protein